MAHFDLGAYFDERRALIERALDAHLPAGDSEPKAVHEAMRYATLGGGKRLRPILALAVAELAGGPAERFIEAACAIELVHTASLVVDDLPAMDDAATRRGKPCAHKVYGEATTILAAVGLLSLAFSLVIRNAQACGVCNQADCVANRLADAIGTRGIIHGQHDDLSFVGRDASIEQLEAAYMQKASCLFQLAVSVPACLAGLPDSDCGVLKEYACNLGMAFQITDDLIDSQTSPEDENKPTFARLLGCDEARDRASRFIAAAIDVLEPFGARAHPLRALAEYVRTRTA